MYTKELKRLVDQLDKKILDAEAHLTALGADELMVYIGDIDIFCHIPDHLSEEPVYLGFGCGRILMFVERVGTTESTGEPICDLPLAVRIALARHIPRLIQLAHETSTLFIQDVLTGLDEILEVEDCCAEA